MSKILSSNSIHPAASRRIFVLLAVVLGLLGVAWIPFQPQRLLLAEELQTTQDLGIDKFHAGNFVIGDTGVYTIEVSNLGNQTVAGVITVSDIVPDALIPGTVTAPGWNPCGFTGQELNCIYSNTNGVPVAGVLPPIEFTVSVSDASPTQIINTASLENVNDSVTANNSDDDQTIIEGLDLEVSKKVSPTNPAELGTVTFTIGVKNNGPNQATNVSLVDQLSTDLTFTGAQATQGTYNAANGVWNIGTLGDQASASLTINATVKAGTRGKQIVNTAGPVSADQYDFDTANDSATVQFVVATTQLAGIVTSAITDNPLADATVVVTDSVSRVYTQKTTSSGWYTFTNTTDNPLAAGVVNMQASKPGYFTKTFPTTIQPGQLNRVDITLDSTDLVLTVTDDTSNDRVVPGREFDYTITVKNSGSITATNVIITDVLDSNLTYITDTLITSNLNITYTKISNTTYNWTLLDGLGPDDKVDFDLSVQLDYALSSATESIVNQTRVFTADPEANTSNNEVVDTNFATGTPNISISQSVSATSVSTGNSTTYTIKVTNSGSAPVTDVVVTETFSSLFDLVSAKTDRGTATRNTSTNKVTVEIDVLDTTQTATIQVVARVNNTARSTTTVSSSAQVSYKFAGTTTTKTSNTISVRIIPSSTLPGTGGYEVDPSNSWAFVPALISALILVGIAGIGLLMAARNRKSNNALAGWLVRMSMLFMGAAVLFSLVGWGLYRLTRSDTVRLAQYFRSAPLSRVEPVSTQLPIAYAWPSEPEGDLEVLPDFPVPEPVIEKETRKNEPQPDTSAVERIVIPAIQVDTIVKYVPYDGNTWMIAGLKEEVAWLGDTSWPGLGGNTVLAGHVTLISGQDGPFRYLEVLAPGDLVTIYTEENAYTYAITAKQVVPETDLSVVEPSQQPLVTLITCTGWNPDLRVYQDRLIVQAELTHTRALKVASTD